MAATFFSGNRKKQIRAGILRKISLITNITGLSEEEVENL